MTDANLCLDSLPGSCPVGVPMTLVELVVTLIRSVELVGIPMTPLEQEGSDNLNPDCPLPPLLVTQQTSISP